MTPTEKVSSLHLNLLGPPRLVRAGEPVAVLRRTKSQALLFYLAVTGGPHRRASLAALLWPDSTDQQAATSLRTALSDLRKLFGEHLAATDQTVSLARAAFWLDVSQFDTLLRKTGDEASDILQLQAAVSLYGGDFLTGFHVPGAPDYEQWLTGERERLRHAMHSALLTLAVWHAQQNDLVASLEQLTRLLAMEPASEIGHRHKMAVLARMGQRSAALLQFDACRRALEEELGVEPAAETLALRELILAGALDAETPAAGAQNRSGGTAPAAQAAAMADMLRSRPQTARARADWGDMPGATSFYGREENQARLQRWITADNAGLIVISGMGGVGKTTLAARAVTRLEPQSYDVIVWRSLVNAPTLDTLLDTWLQTLVDQRLDRIPATMDEKLALLFAELQRQRCLLVLDNAESIMQAGRRKGYFKPGYEDFAQLIARMGRSRHRSCLLMTTRELPLGLQRLEEDYPTVRIMALSGLSMDAGLQLLSDRGVAAPPASLEALVGRYSGNPLALKLVADTVRDLFGADVNAFLSGGTPVFDDIRGVLDEQYDRLSDVQREIITWLAIERRPAPVADLFKNLVTPPNQGEFLEDLRSLQRGSLVEEIGAGHGEPLRLGLQNVVMEYVTERLLQRMREELESGRLDWLQRYALVKAQCPEHVQQSQRRLQLQPLARWLVAHFGRSEAEQHLQALLLSMREGSAHKQGYAAANLLHILLELGIDLRGYDFSKLAIWQADLRQAALQDVDMHGADLTGCTLSNTFGAISCVAVSPDGSLLAAGGTDGVVYIWRMADYQPLHRLSGHRHFIVTLTFSDDGAILASGGFDTEIRLWDVRTGELTRTLRRQTRPLQAWSIDIHGDRLAAASMDMSIHVWNWQTGESLYERSVPGLLDAVAFSPDGRLLAGAGDMLEFNIWDAHTGELLVTRPTAKGRTLALAFSANGALLATGGEDNSIRVWNVADMSLRQVLTGHSNWILSLAFSPDGRHLASGSADHTARLWDIRENRPVRMFIGHSGWVRAVALTPDGEALVTGSDDQTVRLWDARTGEPRHYLHGHVRWVDFVRFSPDGETLASSSFGGSVRLWDVATGRLRHQLDEPQAASRALAFSHDNTHLACGSDDHSAHLWNVETGALERVLHGHRGPVRDVAFTADDRFLITGSHDETLRVWDAATGQQRQVVPNASARIQFATCFDPGGALLAFGALDHSVKLLHIESGEIIASIPLPDKMPVVVAFSPLGDLLACGARDGSVWIWRVSLTTSGEFDVLDSGRQLHQRQEPIWRLLFSPDGNALAFNSESREMRVLEVASGQVRYCVDSHYGAFCVDFSKDGKQLITVSRDNAVLIRDASTGDVQRSLFGHEAALTSLHASPDGARIASSSADGTVRLWNLESGDCEAVLRQPGPYRGMNIAGVTGITPAERATLMALGAVEA